ncbi:MAG TPA: hypothetical protein VFR90_02915 [Methylibium sp.]|uniref:hypothetical protein n=1 Tax=Methylibium sp. TaxID=2067992 RepID=UPI002DBCEC06|nr:hypothetical protein [Methylibium sp.]HEU4458054.1 hypothetical protein [Methylibium sp.]
MRGRKDAEDQRLEGRAQAPEEKVGSYQELLDEALENTFPASDPIAIGAAKHARQPRPTPGNEVDWSLQPGAEPPAAAPGTAKQRS